MNYQNLEKNNNDIKHTVDKFHDLANLNTGEF